MKLIVVAASLAMTALCVSASLDPKKLVKPDLATCIKEISEDWLNLKTPFALDKKSRIDQADECNWWIGNWNNHHDKFKDCYNHGYDKIHDSIRETLVDEAQKKLHERRLKLARYCDDNVAKERKAFPGHDWWEKLHAQPEPVNEKLEALTIKICAESHLMDGEGFRHIPEDFEKWSRDDQAIFCEETQEESIRLDIDECEPKFRKYDYLQFYSEAQKKVYYEIKDGYLKCDQFFAPYDIEAAEAPPKASVGGETSDN